MKSYRALTLLLSVSLILNGCGIGFNSKPKFQADSAATFVEQPLLHTYKYAVSAVVLDEATEAPVSNFSIDVMQGSDESGEVINGLGNKFGLFHVSRQPTLTEKYETLQTFLVSAPGYESEVVQLKVSADCDSFACEGKSPISIHLTRESTSLASNSTRDISGFSPEAVAEGMNVRGALPIFNELVELGKLDPKIQDLIGSARNGDTIQNVLVLLNEISGGETAAEDLVSSLLSGVKIGDVVKNMILGGSGIAGGSSIAGGFASLIPLLASGSPELAVALVAVNLLLPYAKMAVDKIAEKRNGPIITILQALLDDNSFIPNMVGLISSIQSGKPSIQMAIATFLPLLQKLGQGFKDRSIAAALGTQPSPADGLIKQSLKDKPFLNLLTKGSGGLGKLFKRGAVSDGNGKLYQVIPKVSPYIQPLVQGLLGKRAPEISSALDAILKGKKPLDTLRDLLTNSSRSKGIVKILPYFEPLIYGLNGKDSGEIKTFLSAFLNNKSPANAIADLLKNADLDPELSAQLAKGIFPALGGTLKDAVPSKQVFLSQLLQGLANGSLKDLTVVQDLKGAHGVIISGQARDIFKLAQLSNVKKIIALGQ